MLVVIFNRFVTMAWKYNQQRNILSDLISEITASEMVSENADSPTYTKLDLSGLGVD